MITVKIPADIFAISNGYAIDVADGDTKAWFDVRDAVAKAIFDERERCAKIADCYCVLAYPHWDVDREFPKKRKSRDGSNIASLILGKS